MTGKKYPQTSAQKRRMRCYPPPKYFTLIKAYQVVNEMGESEVMTTIIRDFFDRMPEQDRESLIKKSKTTSKNSY